MARHLGLPHEVHHVTAEQYLAGWVESVYAAGEPVRHLQSVLLHLLFRYRAAAGHEAMLCGEAGDSIFGNVSHGFLHRYRRQIAFLSLTRAGSTMAPLVDALGWRRRWVTLLTRRYDTDVSSPRHFLWTLGRRGDPNVARQRLRCDEAALLGERRGHLDPYRDRSLLDQVTASGLLAGVHVTNAIWGKVAEASGIRLAFPYTSPSVLAAAMAVPWDVKLREPKHLARTALRQLGVPEALIVRPKLSFGLPLRLWAPRGTLFQPIVDMAKESYEPGLLESLQTEETGPAMTLWSLLNHFLWTQLFEADRAVDDLAGEIIDRHRMSARRTATLAG
jgi:asparagine synthetase B (glutamine-hydrolysing)